MMQDRCSAFLAPQKRGEGLRRRTELDSLLGTSGEIANVHFFSDEIKIIFKCPQRHKNCNSVYKLTQTANDDASIVLVTNEALSFGSCLFDHSLICPTS